MQVDQYYSLSEVATMLKVAYLTVYRWVQAGKLVAHKAGRQYRIKSADLDNFMRVSPKSARGVVTIENG